MPDIIRWLNNAVDGRASSNRISEITPEEEEAFAEAHNADEDQEQARRAQEDFDNQWEIDSDGHFLEREWGNSYEFDNQVSVSSSQRNRDGEDTVAQEYCELDAAIAEFYEQNRDRGAPTLEEEQALAEKEQATETRDKFESSKSNVPSSPIPNSKRLVASGEQQPLSDKKPSRGIQQPLETSRDTTPYQPNSRAFQPPLRRNDRGASEGELHLLPLRPRLAPPAQRKQPSPRRPEIDGGGQQRKVTTPRQPNEPERQATANAAPNPNNDGSRLNSANFTQQNPGGPTAGGAGTYGNRKFEKQRLAEKFGRGFPGHDTIEAEHIVPFAVHRLPRGGSTQAKKIENSQPAYYEALHRYHPGTENKRKPFPQAWATPESYFIDQERVLGDGVAKQFGTTASNAFQLNQLGYAHVIAGKNATNTMSKTLQQSLPISTDSYQSVVDRDPAVEFNGRQFHLGPIGQAEAYLAREAGVTGQWPTAEDITKALTRYSVDPKEHEKSELQKEGNPSAYDDRPRTRSRSR